MNHCDLSLVIMLLVLMAATGSIKANEQLDESTDDLQELQKGQKESTRGDGLIGQMQDGLSGFMGGKKGAPQASANLDGKHHSKEYHGVQPSSVNKEVMGGGAAVHSGKKKGELFGLFSLEQFDEFTKLILNPFELSKAICAHFKIPPEKFTEKLGKGFYTSIEIILQPVLASLNIIERVFEPDCGRLKFICNLGSQFSFVKDGVVKFSPGFLESSVLIKAMTHGISGGDCGSIFPGCEPKLKLPYEELKKSPSYYSEKH